MGDLRLKQSNKLILATHEMDINQMRLFFFACSQYEGDLTIEVPIEDIYRVLSEDTANRGGNQRELIRRTIPTLMKNAVVHIEDEEWDKWSVVFTNSAIRRNSNIVQFQFNKSIQKELDELRGYTWMYLSNLTGMTSTYSVRLYEFFSMRLGSISTSGSFEFDINQLRIYLDCTNKLKDFRNFDRTVLKKAFKEINEKTNISMSYIKIKTGRSVTSIVFKFAYKDDTNANIVDTTYTVHHDQDNNVLDGQLSFEIQQMLSQFD